MGESPHPENVPGDFYVDDGCCVTCGVPLEEAPHVFAWAKAGDSCIVACQPGSPEAVERTLTAMWASETECIRYRGADPDIARRIAEMGSPYLCDQTELAAAPRLTRTHASFLVDGSEPQDGALGLAASFAAHLQRRSEGRVEPYRVRPAQGHARRARLHLSWHAHRFHAVEIQRRPDTWLAIAKPADRSAATALARLIEHWLRNTPSVGEIRWFSKQQWRAGGPFQSTVI